MANSQRLLWVVVCATAALPAAAAEGTSATPELKVAVLPVKAQSGVKESVAAVVTEQLAAAIQARHYTVLSPDDLAARLGFDRQKQLMGCTDSSCLVEVGQALGVDRRVSGSIAVVGRSVVINLALINNRSGAVDYRYSERVKDATDEAFLDLIPAAVSALFPQQTAEKPPAQVEASAGGASGRQIAAWTTLGLGVVSVAVGATFFGLARGAQDEVSKGNPAPYGSLQEKVAAGKVNDVIAGTAFAVGGALAVTSVLLFALHPTSAASVACAPTAGGGVLVVGGSF